MGWMDKLFGSRHKHAGEDLARALHDTAVLYALRSEPNRASGVVGGIDFTADREPVDPGGERFVLRARLPKRLDLGLRVAMAPESDPRRPFGTGDEAFDRRYWCVADDAERGRAMLPAHLRALLAEGPETDIGDGGVTVAVAAADAVRLDEAVAYALDAASALYDARLATPAAKPLRDVQAAWLERAPEEELSVEATPLSATKRVGRITAETRSVRDGFDQHHFELRAAFPDSLEVGLMLRPHSMTHEHGRTADPVGDAAFDRLFEAGAKGTPIAPLFDPEVRARLLELREAGLQIHGDDRGLVAWLGFKRTDLDSGVRLLAPMAALADALALRVEASAAVR